MEKRIAFYSKKGISGPWPNIIEEKFSRYISKFGVPYFEEGSNEEKEFLKECKNLELEIERQTILKCTGKDLYKQPFYHLDVPVPQKIELDESFMDYSSACDKCGFGTRRIGAKQIKKTKVIYETLKSYDIIGLPDHRRPSILLISKKLKELMEPMNLTGCNFVPCLDKNRQYSENEEDFLSYSDKLEDEAKYFQLIVTKEVNNPPYGGVVKILTPPCQNCGTYNNFFLFLTPYFQQGDLKEVDFQLYEQYDSDNLGRFYMPGDIIIISSRVLKLFIDNKIKLARHMTDPPIKYGVVEIWCLNRHE